MKRTATVSIGAAVLTLLLLIFIGRHERSTWQTKQNRGIAAVRRAVGVKLTDPEAFRTSPQFACLLYPRGGHSYGLELCFAPSGAIVEAIERTPGLNPKIWTLRSEPGSTTVHENPVLVAHLLDRMGAQTGTAIQVGGADVGPEAPIRPAHP